MPVRNAECFGIILQGKTYEETLCLGAQFAEKATASLLTAGEQVVRFNIDVVRRDYDDVGEEDFKAHVYFVLLNADKRNVEAVFGKIEFLIWTQRFYV